MKKSGLISVLLAAALLINLLALSSFAAFADTEINVTNAKELKTALNGKAVVDSINITADITVDDDCTIVYDNDHIDYYSNTVVTIAEGVTVTVADGGMLGSMWPTYSGDWQTPPLPNGKFINNGTIIVENGGKIEADFATNNGSVYIKNGGEVTAADENNGTVLVENGGIYATTQGGRAVNKGEIAVEEGAVMESRFGTTIENAEDAVINLKGDFYCGCNHFDKDVMLFENHGTVNGNGSVFLYEALPGVDMDAMIEAMMSQLGQEKRFENWDDISIYKSVEAADYTSLKAILSEERVVAGEKVDGNMDTIVTLNGNIEVPEGESIETMALIEVPSDVTVTVDGGALLQCGIDNDGTVDVLSGGKLETTMGGNIVNHNILSVAQGASVRSQMGGIVINRDGASFNLNGDFLCGCIGIDKDVAWFENSGTVNGTGNIILCEIMPVKEMAELAYSVAQHIGGTGYNLPEVIVHNEHSMELTKTIKPATCDENGEGEYTCSVCGETKTDIIPALGHNWDKGSVTKKATPTKTGVLTYTCTVCGARKTQVIPKCAKYANTLTIKTKNPSVKYKSLRKKTQTISLKAWATVSKAQGKVSYKLSSVPKQIKKYIKISSEGVITFKKWAKAKKADYKIKVQISAKGNSSYNGASVTKTVTIKVK